MTTKPIDTNGSSTAVLIFANWSLGLLIVGCPLLARSQQCIELPGKSFLAVSIVSQMESTRSTEAKIELLEKACDTLCQRTKDPLLQLSMILQIHSLERARSNLILERADDARIAVQEALDEAQLLPQDSTFAEKLRALMKEVITELNGIKRTGHR